jgi:hypothetical protein
MANEKTARTASRQLGSEQDLAELAPPGSWLEKIATIYRGEGVPKQGTEAAASALQRLTKALTRRKPGRPSKPSKDIDDLLLLAAAVLDEAPPPDDIEVIVGGRSLPQSTKADRAAAEKRRQQLARLSRHRLSKEIGKAAIVETGVKYGASEDAIARRVSDALKAKEPSRPRKRRPRSEENS